LQARQGDFLQQPSPPISWQRRFLITPRIDPESLMLADDHAVPPILAYVIKPVERAIHYPHTRSRPKGEVRHRPENHPFGQNLIMLSAHKLPPKLYFFKRGT